MSLCLVDEDFLGSLGPFGPVARAGVLEIAPELPTADSPGNNLCEIDRHIVGDVNLSKMDEQQHDADLTESTEYVPHLLG